MTLSYQEQMSRGMPRGTFDSMSDAPTAAAYGVGSAWIGGRLYWSDGSAWDRIGGLLPRKANTVYVLGDSFDERSEPSITSLRYTTSHYSIFHLTNALLGNAFYPVGIDGASGTGVIAGGTTTGYAYGSARLDAALASGAKYLYIRASVNDPDSATNPTASDLIEAYKLIFDAANTVGMTVICSNIAPGAYASTAAKRKVAQYFNAWLDYYAANNYDLIVLPCQYPLLDSTSTNYTANTSTGYSEDGTHPDATAAFKLAQIHAAILQPIVGKMGLFSATYTDSAIAMPNPINKGTGGTAGTGVTGSVADGMTLQQTSGTPTACVASKVARTDAAGYWQKVVWTPDTTGRALQYVASSGVDTTTDLAIGDVVSFCFELTVPSTVTATDVGYFSAGATLQGSSGAYDEVWGTFTSSSRIWGTSGWTGIFCSPPVAIPAGCYRLWAQLRAFNATTNPLEFSIGRNWIMNYSLLDRL